MKKIFLFLSLVALIVSVSSCDGGGKGTKFAPQEKESKMSDEERAAAIAKARSQYNINLDTLLFSHGVKLSILEPKTLGEDITTEIAQAIGVKMLEIATQNGISGLGTAPGFVMGTEIMQTGRAATGTAPQKMTVQYTLTFKVMNNATGDVFATATQEITGVGNSFIEANQNAVKNIKNTPAMQQMLQTASNRIIEWYNKNLGTLKSQVESAAGKGDYALALALVESVPEQATEAFQYAAGKIEGLTQGLMHKKAADMLGEMTSLMASSGDNFDPAVGAYFKMIPTDSPEHAKAQELYTNYEQKCKARKEKLEAKAERDEQAANELKKLEMKYAHETEIAEIECEKMKAKYQAQAAAQAAQAKNSKGFWGKMGDRVLSVTDRAIKGMDVIDEIMIDKFELGDYYKKVEEKSIDY